jgi:hypothetical protein
MLTITNSQLSLLEDRYFEVETAEMALLLRRQQPKASEPISDSDLLTLVRHAVLAGREYGLVTFEHAALMAEGSLLLGSHFYVDRVRYPSVVAVLHNRTLAVQRKATYLSEILVFAPNRSLQ